VQRVERSEYEEWRNSLITEQLFNFFKLEAELYRRRLASGEVACDTFQETGERYTKLLFAAQCYEMLDSVTFEDLFPTEETVNESSKDA
jgi:hypothetical protein